MDGNRVISSISPEIGGKKGSAGCQCELGRDKLLTAPPYRPCPIQDDVPKSRFSTAPCRRDFKEYKCPVSHTLVTFKSPMHPKEAFSKVFPSNTPIKFVKRKLAKLLSVSNSNLLLTINRSILKETSLLSNLKTDAHGNLTVDVYTKDSEKFALSSIPKENYVHELLQSILPKKKALPFIAIKFRIRNQTSLFTRSYHSAIKIHEIKKNLAGLFQVAPENLVLLRGENPLKDRMALSDLDYNKYGIVEVELLTKDTKKLNLDKLYKELPSSDILAVTVPFGTGLRQLNVEVFSRPIEKPFLGGFKNIHTGVIYHHAFTQTPQKPEKVSPERKNCRDTQTAEEIERVLETNYSRSTQMATEKVYIPSVTDKIIIPKRYETYEEKIARLNHKHYATIIQRAFRHHQFRQKVERWLKECKERIRRMQEEDRLEREAMERRLRRDLITRTFPKTREDFDQLYAMVDRWKHGEISRISRLHSKGPKIAEFTLLLDKEVELLRCIEAYRLKVREDSRKTKDKKFLEEISKPVAWFGRDGKLITMDTIEIQKARKLKELYNSFLRTDLEVNERIELLVDMKAALQEFSHDLVDEVMALLDRECDLLVRRCDDHQLEFLRRRISASVLQVIKTSELNSGVTKCKDIRDYQKMEEGRLYLCEMCNQVKLHTEFPLNAKMSGFLVCMSCSWKDVTERLWIDMTPYRFILRAVQREERRRKCWGSLAFVLQEKDVFFIVEKLWHSHSAISECADMSLLRLCRWHVGEDWAPWNCFLVTVEEMKEHLKLENPEAVYDEELISKVANKHKLARANFEQLISINKRFTESGDWQGIRAPAVAHVNAVDRITLGKFAEL
ncbi:PREDICTED: IQ and ubiquitin-like domain-containing protein [Papilio polytes]|uniref:IQ and ubiquitin-like domain-containing protein n=1 Tax=Papilio polytes TaxID=76194 RepID=UPI000675D26E|nr:PREDICTED: IQ and ubiquitin-like domain-containing protein [Papilio polytes]